MKTKKMIYAIIMIILGGVLLFTLIPSKENTSSSSPAEVTGDSPEGEIFNYDEMVATIPDPNCKLDSHYYEIKESPNNEIESVKSDIANQRCFGTKIGEGVYASEFGIRDTSQDGGSGKIYCYGYVYSESGDLEDDIYLKMSDQTIVKPLKDSEINKNYATLIFEISSVDENSKVYFNSNGTNYEVNSIPSSQGCSDTKCVAN